MKKAIIGGMIMVASFVFILSAVGGLQQDTIGELRAILSFFGGIFGLLVGFRVMVFK